MKFILFNLVVTGALVFLIMDKGGTVVEIPTVAEVQDKVEAALDRTAPKDEPGADNPPLVRNTTAPVEAVLGEDMAREAEPAKKAAPAEPAPDAVKAPRPEPAREPVREPVRQVEVASAFDAPAAAPLPPAPPGLSPEVAKRRAEVLGAAPSPVRRDVRPVLQVTEDERAALVERRLKLQDLAEEMELMAAEAAFR